MANTVRILRSTTAGATPSALVSGQIAINEADGILFYRNASGVVTQLPTGSGATEVFEYATTANFPATGSAASLYIDTDRGRVFRWETNAYAEVGPVGGIGLSWSSAPASATASGSPGSIAYDGSYIYLCTANSTWVRAAVSTWVPFSPASVAGLQAWYDASDASTLFNATSGGSLVAADGSVARWEDKSGNGRHLTQSTSGSRPLRKTGVQNGLATLRFDGSDDFLSVPSSTAAFTFLHDGDHTIFMVFKVNVPSSSRRRLLDTCIDNGSPSGNKGMSIAYFNDFGSATPYSKMGQLVVNTGGAVRVNSYTGDNSYPNNTACVLTIKGDPANATDADRATFYNNGTARAETPASEGASLPSGSASFDLTVFTSGGSTGRTYAAGDLCEMALYNSALSDADRTAVESYLIAKWGIV